jgi:S-adenosyl methyltransferase
VARLLAALPSGSYFSLNEGTSAIMDNDASPMESQAYEDAQREYNESGAIPYVLRTPEEIALFFDGLELVEPGSVSVPLWRPEAGPPDSPHEAGQSGGVGRKP